MFNGKANNQNLADPQSLNPYSYGEDNPINLEDPGGKLTQAQAANYQEQINLGQQAVDLLYEEAGLAQPSVQVGTGGGGGGSTGGGGSQGAGVSVPVVQTQQGSGGGGSNVQSTPTMGGSSQLPISGFGTLSMSGDDSENGPIITPKIADQMGGRGWTTEDINNIYSNPYTTRVATDKATGDPATAYYNEEGNYISVNNVTKEVIQVSNKNDLTWKPDSTIEDPYTPPSPTLEPEIIPSDEIFPFE